MSGGDGSLTTTATELAPGAFDLAQRLADELGIARWQAANTLLLLDQGNTVPFIARYRKERTGELDEETLRRLKERAAALRALEERRQEVRRLLAEQGNLTPELDAALATAESMQRIEDLYRPYRPRRRTRAQIAREKGLEPLAEAVLTLTWPADILPGASAEELAARFVDPEKGVEQVEDALAGALDIVAEVISDDPDVRALARELTSHRGMLSVEQAKDADPEIAREYEIYFAFAEKISRLRPHQVLAINRGERQGALKVRVEMDAQAVVEAIGRLWTRRHGLSLSAKSDLQGGPDPVARVLLPLLLRAVEDGYRRLLGPAVERELRSALTEEAEEHAIGVFAQNLRKLLLQPPVRSPASVIGIDPGYRTGCKVAVVDPTGAVLAVETIYPHPPQSRWSEARSALADLVDRHQAAIIAIGNGTASRETERLVAELIQTRPHVRYIVVNEAGASVYSASPLAKKELPGLDVSMRGAVSIARRLLDPLAELVKIDPQSIGVGLYQHDVNPKRLGQALADVVESCVNYVGVELNTASAALLRHVAGISERVAQAIVAHRSALGRFTSRAQLLDVPGLGPKTFEQCAGFLRIQEAVEPLDRTAVHPESYETARAVLRMIGARPEDLASSQGVQAVAERLKGLDPEAVAAQLGVGAPTLRDICEALAKPGRDPREELPQPLFRADVFELDDLEPGMTLEGTVTNVVDFGAFVDIGVERAGLIHVSQMGKGYVKNPHEVLAVGDIVTVRVIQVDRERGRISLALVDR